MIRPQFSPQATPIYAVLVIGFCASLTFALALGFTFDLIWAKNVPWLLYFCGCAWLVRSIGWNRVADPVEAICLGYLLMPALALALYPMTAISMPLAEGNHLALRILVDVYVSFFWQPAALIVCLATHGLKPWRFVLAMALSLVAAIVIYPLVPAKGPFITNGMTSFPGYDWKTPWHFFEVMQQIKGGLRHITPSEYTGFVSFPSFHTSGAVLFMLAAWPMRYLRWVFIALNLFLLAAIPVIGAHYFIDVIGGAAIAMIMWKAAFWIEQRPAQQVISRLNPA